MIKFMHTKLIPTSEIYKLKFIVQDLGTQVTTLWSGVPLGGDMTV